MQPLIERIYEVFAANQDTFTAAGMEPIKTIDLYRSQPLNPEKFEYYETPALFLDYRLAWQQQGKRYIAIGELDAHVVYDQPFETSNVFTGYADALKQAFYIDLVRLVLDNIESDVTSKLIRQSERPVDTGVICYHVLTYGFNYYDLNTGSNTIQVDDATVEIVNKDLVKRVKTIP